MVTDEEVSSYSQYSIEQEPLPRRGDNRGGSSRSDNPVMLSAAKHLHAHPHTPLAAFQVAKAISCHAERSEASPRPSRETLPCAQGDKGGDCHVERSEASPRPSSHTPPCVQRDKKASSLPYDELACQDRI